MDDNKGTTYVQCLFCGHIYKTNQKFSIDDSVIKCTCPKCKHDHGLLCENDLYKYYDPVFDLRFYDYK